MYIQRILNLNQEAKPLGNRLNYNLKNWNSVGSLVDDFQEVEPKYQFQVDVLPQGTNSLGYTVP